MMRTCSRRAFGLLGGAALLAFEPARAAATESASAFDPTPYIHPELRPAVGRLKAYFGTTPLNAQTLPDWRRKALAPPPLAAPAWSERLIPGPPGAPDVRVYVINPRAPGGGVRPAILHIHGGGFVLGDARSAIRGAQEVAAAVDALVVSVDYRLAPETRFPGALEDNYAALKWLHANAVELGVDRSRIAVMGESAGGGHAAMLAIAARDRGEIPIVYQALVYPMLDDRTGSTRKKPPYMGALIWDEARNRFGWSALLGVPAGSRRVPDGAVPARVENLKGLPPAFIGVGSIDLFVDEDIEYARRLIDVGVPVELNVVPGAFHGFEGLGQTTIGKAFKADLHAALRNALRGTP